MGMGLYLDFADGHSPIELTANLRAPSFCRRIDFSTGGNRARIDEWVPGSEFLIIPRNCVQTAQVQNQGKVWRVLNHFFVENNNEIVFRTWASNLGGNQSFNAVWDSTVWQILPVGGGNYGLYIQNSTNFAEISDASRVGSCVFVGTVHIDGDWRVPDIGGVNRGTHVCFARWSAGGVTLSFDGEIVRARHEGGSNAQVDVNIAVFAQAPIEAPSGQWGLAILNRSNQVTFSTKRRPFIWDGFKLGLSRDWRDIGNRMVSLGRYGVIAHDGGHHLLGFQMDGNNVRLASGERIDSDSKQFEEWMAGEVPCIQSIF
ncbi:hypothetical protein SB5439_04978 [Klebsiella variicola]|uniref:DUF6453 family protein n=1 Tax=Klebsiella variicola TaxID=244366 RepID=UPI00109C55A2|nr:DUF6453 family protein [Klebsiella variicola]VGQ11648.1 hypothetical protein SB5439_04978 [Klebsiella variicola]